MTRSLFLHGLKINPLFSHHKINCNVLRTMIMKVKVTPVIQHPQTKELHLPLSSPWQEAGNNEIRVYISSGPGNKQTILFNISCNPQISVLVTPILTSRETGNYGPLGIKRSEVTWLENKVSHTPSQSHWPPGLWSESDLSAKEDREAANHLPCSSLPLHCQWIKRSHKLFSLTLNFAKRGFSTQRMCNPLSYPRYPRVYPQGLPTGATPTLRQHRCC